LFFQCIRKSFFEFKKSVLFAAKGFLYLHYGYQLKTDWGAFPFSRFDKNKIKYCVDLDTDDMHFLRKYINKEQAA